ncbi:hypothetical protein AX17_005877 [Amanita inopinata Kibby_2008]|nr:hypothetical protein AX17_005877 [Amanita inopinata Kibby_2008]
MSASKLSNQCISVPASTVLAFCTRADALIEHVFATVWPYEGGRVAWVTQLVVDATVRKRYVATHFLQMLKSHPLFYDIAGIGLARVKVENVDTNFIAANARKILETTPIDYLKPSNVDLHGSLFETDCKTGAISSAFTKFYVDHKEPSEVLAVFQKAGHWCSGELLDEHEFLVLVPVDKLL